MRRPLMPLLVSLVPVLLMALPAAAQPGLSALDVVRTQVVTTVEVSPDGRHLLFLRTKPRLADDAPGRDYRELYVLPLRSDVQATPEAAAIEAALRRIPVARVPVAAGERTATELLQKFRALSRLRVHLRGVSALPMPHLHRLEPLEEFHEAATGAWESLPPLTRPSPWNPGHALQLLEAMLVEMREVLGEPSLTWRPTLKGDIEIGTPEDLGGAPLGRAVPRPLLAGKVRVGEAHFTSDGHFVSVVLPTEAGQREVHLIPVTGGQPMPLTTTPRGVGAHRMSPDGRHIAYTAPDAPSDGATAAKGLGFSAVVVEEAPHHTGLWIWDRETGASRRVSPEGMTVHDFVWSPNSASLAYSAATEPWIDHMYMFQSLHWYDLASGAGGTFDKEVPSKIGHFAWSPSGDTLAYIGGADRRDPHAGTLHLVARGGSRRALTADLPGMVHDVHWTAEDEMRCVISLGVKTHQAIVDRSGAYRLVPGGGDVACRAISLTNDGRVYGAGSSGTMPDEVVQLTEDGVQRLTWSNPWLAKRRLAAQRVERFVARDGLNIEGLFLESLDTTPGPKPLVIVVHGGPEAHYSDAWVTRYAEPGQALAAKGFHVWYPNYRASTGYGVAFAKLDHGDPMGGQFEDHLDAIRHFTEAGLVDRERVGIIGGSYGGYTAAWAATHGTEHFAAAVSFVPFTDMVSKWWAADIPWEFFLVHYKETWPDGQKQLLEDRSPLTHAAKCRTPLLLLGGTSDTRVHPSQPHMLWRKVKLLTKTPVRYVQYPGEGHGNGVNVHRYDYCVRGMRWLEHYLKPEARAATPPSAHLDLDAWKATGGWRRAPAVGAVEVEDHKNCCEHQ